MGKLLHRRKRAQLQQLILQAKLICSTISSREDAGQGVAIQPQMQKEEAAGAMSH